MNTFRAATLEQQSCAKYNGQVNPPTMKDIIQRNVTIKDDIKDFDGNLKGVSKEIMRKSRAVLG